MINTADECYSIENFSYTFCHTVTSCGFLGAVHKPLNYVTNRLTRPLFENSLDQQFKEIQQRTKALAEYMKQQGLELHRNYIIKNKHKIDENSDIFKYIKAETQRINSLQNQYIEMANAAKELQQKIKEGNDIDGLLLKHDLISPFNTPSNILNQKIQEAQTNLQQAQRNNNQQDITKYEGLLAEYQKVKERLKKDYFNGEKRTEYGITTEQAEANSKFMDDQIEHLFSTIFHSQLNMVTIISVCIVSS